MHFQRPAFSKAIRECERWEVTVTVTEDPQYNRIDSLDFYVAPQSHAGICKKTGSIIWADDETDSVGAAQMMHELAHVVVWRELGWNPNTVEEPKHMLGLEYEACRRSRANFTRAMEGYTLLKNGDMHEWHHWSTRVRGEFISRSIGFLNGRGLMRNGKPTYRHRFNIIDGKQVPR